MFLLFFSFFSIGVDVNVTVVHQTTKTILLEISPVIISPILTKSKILILAQMENLKSLTLKRILDFGKFWINYYLLFNLVLPKLFGKIPLNSVFQRHQYQIWTKFGPQNRNSCIANFAGLQVPSIKVAGSALSKALSENTHGANPRVPGVLSPRIVDGPQRSLLALRHRPAATSSPMPRSKSRAATGAASPLQSQVTDVFQPSKPRTFPGLEIPSPHSYRKSISADIAGIPSYGSTHAVLERLGWYFEELPRQELRNLPEGQDISHGVVRCSVVSSHNQIKYRSMVKYFCSYSTATELHLRFPLGNVVILQVDNRETASLEPMVLCRIFLKSRPHAGSENFCFSYQSQRFVGFGNGSRYNVPRRSRYHLTRHPMLAILLRMSILRYLIWSNPAIQFWIWAGGCGGEGGRDPILVLVLEESCDQILILEESRDPTLPR